MRGKIKRLSVDSTVYDIYDESAVHEGDLEVNISISGQAKTAVESEKLIGNFGSENNPVFFENGVPQPVTIINISAGGTGGSTPEAARKNLEVYSISELNNKIEEWTFTLSDGSIVIKKVMTG